MSNVFTGYCTAASQERNRKAKDGAKVCGDIDIAFSVLLQYNKAEPEQSRRNVFRRFHAGCSHNIGNGSKEHRKGEIIC